MTNAKQYTLLRKLLKALGLSDERSDELVALIQSWLTGETADEQTALPYRQRDDFLSPAELNFYRVLQTAASDWALILTKVNLADLFYVSTGDFSQNRVYLNKIDRKHVDFLLCDPQTVQPLAGVELDDKSHQRPDRQERDAFVDAVFAAAGLPLARVRVRASYPTDKLNRFLRQTAGLKNEPAAAPIPSPTAAAPETAVATTPTCPKCGGEMVLRTARRGSNAGNQFWGCANYPQCRSILPYDAAEG